MTKTTKNAAGTSGSVWDNHPMAIRMIRNDYITLFCGSATEKNEGE